MTDSAIVDSSVMMNWFLYGQSDTPDNLDSSSIIRDVESTSSLQVTMKSYMDKLGRFAPPSQFELIKDFFASGSAIPTKYDSSGNVTYYTKSELAELFGLSYYGLVVEQYQVDDGKGDYAERTLLWNSTQFKISDDAQFWVGEDGSKSIKSLAIEPMTDNFDLKSSSWPTQVANVVYLQNRLDPYNIGRTVNISYTGGVDRIDYYPSDYMSDLAKSSTWTTPDPISAFNAVAGLVSILNQNNLISPLDEAGRPIIYGTNESDTLSDTSGTKPFYEGKNGAGVAFIAGDGNDTITGTSGSDFMDGGAGFDTVDYSSNSSADPIQINFDGTSLEPVITVQDGRGGTDTLRYIEKIIGTKGDDTFSFKGNIPDDIDLLIDSGGGSHDKISLQNSTDSAGLKLYITKSNAGLGYIQSRSGPGGMIRVKNFHTDIIGSDYADVISDNSSGEHVINAGAGDDKITVSGAGATIDGGAGNDVIHLKSTSATIQFGVGGGHDVVEFDSGDGDYNLALQNLNPNDVEIIAGGRYIYGSGIWQADNPGSDGWHAQFIAVKILSTGETITFLENGNNVGPGGSTYDVSPDQRKLDSITFTDGTVISQDDLWSAVGAGPYSFVNGTAVRFDAWAYNKDYPNYGPYLRPSSQYLDYINATYLQAAPIGAPPVASDESLVGTAGDDSFYPGDGNDTITGGAGADTIRESRGDDTYVWNPGDGDDTIVGSDASDGFNTLRLGSGIAPTDLEFAVANDGAGLVLSFANVSGSISLTDELVGDGYGVDRLVFADGTVMTRADLVAAASSVIAAAQTTMNGTAGADYVFAPRGNFVIDGAAGDDTIVVNGSGSGTFRFSSAGGHDQIRDGGLGYSRNDALELTDVNPGGVTLSRSGDALQITVVATGATVRIANQFAQDDGNIHGVSKIEFADGTIWTRGQIHDLIYTGNTPPTAGAATVDAIQDADIVHGTLVATDPDAGDTLTFKLNAPVAGLVVAANGSWTFDPSDPAYQHLALGQQLTLIANYHVIDSAGATSSSALTLIVTGTNDIPTAVQELANQKLANNEDFLLDVTSYFADPDGDALAFSALLADGSGLPGWLTFSNGQFSGTAPADSSGNLDIVVSASDGTLAAFSEFHLHFGPNLAPVAQALSSASGSINSPLDIAIPAETFADPDGDSLTLSATLADGAALPDWLSFSNGHLVGTPPDTAAGTYAIKIIASDGELDASSTFSLSIAEFSIFNGTVGDDSFDLTTAFVVTGGLGDDHYTVNGDGSGVFNFSKGDGHDELDQPDNGIRSDTLILTNVNSDDVSVSRLGDSATFTVDDTGDTFKADWQFYGDDGGVPQGIGQVQFADGMVWDRNEIFNRSVTNEISVDGSSPNTGTAASETFVIGSGLGAVVIDSFSATGSDHDYLQFNRSQFDGWAHLLGATVQQGSDLVINLDANDSVRLTGVSLSAFTSLDVRFVGSAPV